MAGHFIWLLRHGFQPGLGRASPLCDILPPVEGVFPQYFLEFPAKILQMMTHFLHYYGPHLSLILLPYNVDILNTLPGIICRTLRVIRLPYVK